MKLSQFLLEKIFSFICFPEIDNTVTVSASHRTISVIFLIDNWIESLWIESHFSLIEIDMFKQLMLLFIPFIVFGTFQRLCLRKDKIKVKILSVKSG